MLFQAHTIKQLAYFLKASHLYLLLDKYMSSCKGANARPKLKSMCCVFLTTLFELLMPGFWLECFGLKLKRRLTYVSNVIGHKQCNWCMWALNINNGVSVNRLSTRTTPLLIPQYKWPFKNVKSTIRKSLELAKNQKRKIRIC